MTEEIKFEKAVANLEKIVEELESGELDLDQALKRYEEGVKLSRACTKKLAEAEKKIEILNQTLNSLDEEGNIKPKKSKKKSSKSSETSADDLDLLA
ncbi:MAG: exodeoxyribonuclease VII small subunit [Candidatus Omnitrophica bacterium CG11_big_fil_rev_8_21_14_0_20_45_26]|uniref:Exodeoxyribonuclease 7 small subunit n=1 Tax=Candidatus Abzuiibacterium crystallinum TaxID=1974748 RepID=A0A2H0LSH0_9BACT|nr:MAG: exodeoxyribonuclease VII small subunit [Candidatus Omnitrophica bacterium CG11_big_fil_rev_8_21_14_0_20_45_26]PIW65620.1 MAG: exodeoxyribonuclease VII small subunit [Candidatus Omnitrophica bacterium CG12_big_fil_rev_8_21_14_0_65_45_16]